MIPPSFAYSLPHTLPEALTLLAHYGDIAHGDPDNDHPAIAIALEANFVVAGRQGERRIAAVDFFLAPFTTALADDENLTAILGQPFSAHTGSAYFIRSARRVSRNPRTSAAFPSSATRWPMPLRSLA
jgi:CO/xanthine dehydrogenase FAD-binding subunit